MRNMRDNLGDKMDKIVMDNTAMWRQKHLKEVGILGRLSEVLTHVKGNNKLWMERYFKSALEVTTCEYSILLDQADVFMQKKDVYEPFSLSKELQSYGMTKREIQQIRVAINEFYKNDIEAIISVTKENKHLRRESPGSINIDSELKVNKQFEQLKEKRKIKKLENPEDDTISQTKGKKEGELPLFFQVYFPALSSILVKCISFCSELKNLYAQGLSDAKKVLNNIDQSERAHKTLKGQQARVEQSEGEKLTHNGRNGKGNEVSEHDQSYVRSGEQKTREKALKNDRTTANSRSERYR